MIGFISKNDDEQLVGSYSKGLKLAALIMSRDGYKVSLAVSHSQWSFGLHRKY